MEPQSKSEALIALVQAGEPNLLQVLATLAEHPHRELVTDTPLVSLQDLTEPDTERFLELVTDPTALSPAWDEPVHFQYQGFSYQFTKIYDARPRVTFDTHPNRFVVHVVRRLQDALLDTEDEAAQTLAATLGGLLSRGGLAQCGTAQRLTADHNVLRKDPNYREVLKLSVTLSEILAGP
ncbi:MAG: putative component of viral defense system (DUF524 family) [Myxococcota bacterium]